jgi:antitoxin PrlF
MLQSTLTSRGRITIPKEVRQRLGLRPGDQLIFQLDETGKLIIEPDTRGPLGDLPGLLQSRQTR